MGPMRHQRSPIWLYFDLYYEESKKFGSCKECKTQVVCSSGSTSGLAFHLSHKHQQIFEEFKQRKQQGEMVSTKHEIDDQKEDLIYESDFKERDAKNLDASDLQQSGISISEKIVLSDDEFASDLVNVFKELANDVDFTNVTLVTDGGKLMKAHQVVLSSFSTFFKSLLVKNVHQHPILYLRGVKFEDLRAILDFIYLGQTKVEIEKVTGFLDLAADLQIKGLKDNPDLSNIAHIGNDTNLTEDTELINDESQPEGKKENSTVDNLYSYACHLCQYVAKSKSRINSHMGRTHAESVQHCSKCDYYPKDKNDLQKHDEQQHTMKDTLIC